MAYVIFNTVFYSSKYVTLIIYLSSVLSFLLWYNISKKTTFDKVIKIHIILFILHLAIALLQKVTQIDFLFISQFLSNAGQEGYGQIIKHRVPGLTFISADFYAPISLVLAYLLVYRVSLLIPVIACVLYVNLSKIFAPAFLILVAYHYLLGRKKNTSFFIIIIMVTLINVAGFGASIFLYDNSQEVAKTYISRVMYLEYMKIYLMENFVFGIGFDNFKDGVESISLNYGIRAFNHNPHNIFIKFISELGLLGISIFFISIKKIFDYRDCTFSSESKPEKVMKYSIYLFFTQLSFHNYHLNSEIYSYLGMLAAYKLSNNSHENNRKNYK